MASQIWCKLFALERIRFPLTLGGFLFAYFRAWVKNKGHKMLWRGTIFAGYCALELELNNIILASVLILHTIWDKMILYDLLVG